MTGTVINITTILIGGLIGLFFGSRLPEKIRQTVVAVIGLFTLALGIKMFFESENIIIVLISLLIGSVVGEAVRIEDGLTQAGVWLEKKFIKNSSSNSSSSRFVKGFFTASLVFTIGPMAFLGSIQDGLTGDYELLAVKSVLDGFASIAFASTLGIGVLFSALVIFIYQGTLTLLANQVQSLVSLSMIQEITAVGGVILVGLAISSLLEIKPIRIGNALPALLITPLILWLFEYFSIF